MIDKEIERRFLENMTIVYNWWWKAAEEYREKHANRTVVQKIIDKLTYKGDKSRLSRFSDFNNITLKHCEDLDEIMGDYFGSGTWQRGDATEEDKKCAFYCDCRGMKLKEHNEVYKEDNIKIVRIDPPTKNRIGHLIGLLVNRAEKQEAKENIKIVEIYSKENRIEPIEFAEREKEILDELHDKTQKVGKKNLELIKNVTLKARQSGIRAHIINDGDLAFEKTLLRNTAEGVNESAKLISLILKYLKLEFKAAEETEDSLVKIKNLYKTITRKRRNKDEN